MNLSVTKDNKDLFELDLSSTLVGNEDSSFSFFIGRGKTCKVLLDDKRISREHAVLKYDKGTWLIEKCDTYNELSVNGVSCDSKTLTNGDLITVGPFAMNVSQLNNTDENEPSSSEPSGIAIGLGEEATELRSDATDSNIENEQVEVSPQEDIQEELDTKETEQLDEGFLNEDDQPSDTEGGAGDEEMSFDSDEGDFGSGFEEGEEGFEGSYDDEEGYDLDTIDDDGGTKILQSFGRFELELSGEYAPYDKYNLEDAETIIGRDPEKANIVLGDPEVSSVHAKITKKAMNCSLEDLKSVNGTLLNGERINLSDLKNGDEFVIGSTTFTVSIKSDFLDQEKNRIMPVEENQVVEVQEIVEVDKSFDGELQLGEEAGLGAVDMTPTSNSLFSKDALKDPEKRKKLLYILVGLMALWILLDDGKSKTKKPPKKKAKKEQVVKSKKGNVKPLTKEEKEIVDAHYILVTQFHNEGKYAEVIMEADKIYAITPTYKNLNQYVALAKEGVKRSEQLEQERREKERERQRKIKVKALLKKAEEAIKEKKMSLAEGILDEVVSLDPNNDDVLRYRREISLYRKEQERIAIEKAQKEAERKRQVQELSPGKTYFLQKEWYKATLKLAEFLRAKSIDEDLRKEAADMLNKSKNELNNIVAPLLGKARSLKEGQDMKGAYEVYLEILDSHPAHEAALNEMNSIRERLENRSKKIYREAIIAESLSLYDDAKAKFQEVQQVSPTDSEYYKKATEKLKGYLD